MILAEASNEFAGQWLYITIAVIGAVAGIWGMIHGSKAKVQIDPQPVEVRKSQKRFNHDLAESRHADHERRILALERAHNEILSKLDTDKEEILQAGADRELRLQRELSEMPGKIVADILNTRKLFER